jgi:hypothetical protein
LPENWLSVKIIVNLVLNNMNMLEEYAATVEADSYMEAGPITGYMRNYGQHVKLMSLRVHGAQPKKF